MNEVYETVAEVLAELRSEAEERDLSLMHIFSRNRQNVLKPTDFVTTLLEGKVKYQKLPSGNSDYIEFYDKNGEMVATYSNNGWTTVSYTHLFRQFIVFYVCR